MAFSRHAFFVLLSLVLCNIFYANAEAKSNVYKVKHNSLSPALIDPKLKIEKTSFIKDRPTIALALGGGGIRGAAHIGVLRVLEKEGIPIDYIAGCSMGSIVGGLYAAGIPIDDIQKVLLDKSLQEAYAPGYLSWAIIMFPIKNFTSRLTFRDRPYAGLFSGRKFRAFINKRLPENKRQIENTNIPFVAVVTNLLDGQAYKLAKGDLADCILASSAMAPIVRPIKINGNLYMDGAVRSNVPVVSAKQFGADIVIAVPVDEVIQKEPARKYWAARNVALRIADIVLSVVDEHHLQQADLVIAPHIHDVPVFTKKLKYIKPTIAEGEKAAYAALPQIREAIKNYQAKITTEKLVN